MNNNKMNQEEQILDRYACDEEERAKWANERAERERFIDGLKRYPEKGVKVYIDGKIAGPYDWEKLTMVREDNRFYMGDFIQDDSRLKEIHFDMVYHGEIQSERETWKKRGKKKSTPRETRNEKESRTGSGARSDEEQDGSTEVEQNGGVKETTDA